MDIDFGVGIRSYFFEPKTPITMGVIAEKIQKQAKKYMPFISINKIDFSGTQDDSLLGIKIAYTITPLQESDQITVDSAFEGI